MILGIAWPVWLSWLLAVFFLGNAVANAVNPPLIREGWARWGFPSWFNWVNAGLQLAAGILLLAPGTRMLGLAVGLAICLGIFATLIRHREFGHLGPGAVLCAAILVCGAGLAA